jgi:hypothetical protein
MSSIPKGTWVEVERNLSGAAQRLQPWPFDAGRPSPAVLRVAGFLMEDAELGQSVRVRTVNGRIYVGQVRIQNPGYGYSFAHAAPELRPSLQKRELRAASGR